MVYEANLRLRDPVYGCMGAISTLQQQVQSLQAELHAIRAEILKYKYREAASFISSQVSIPTNNANSQGLSQPLVLPTLAPPSPSLPPPQKVLASQSIILSALSSSSGSSVYTPSKSTMSHGSISSENIPYFV
jgi:hypothetical protein